MKPTGATRLEPRVSAAAVPAITGVKLSSGDVVKLINISRSGILVEGKTRFVPGTRVTLTFEGALTPSRVRAKIVRCQVSSISGGSLCYQCGLQFDQPVDLHLADEVATVAAAKPEAAGGSGPPGTPAASADRGLVNRW
jgi:hypothetical protein